MFGPTRSRVARPSAKHGTSHCRAPIQARAAFAKKAAARKTSAENVAQPVRLRDKREILAITGLTYPTIWKMMRAGTFPRGRVVGGKSMWRSDEVDEWFAGLPIRRLKGDDVAPEKVSA
jgi:predicted DNA-binding transcriptional regulator AlpA